MRRGVTLIELLIAVGILALLAAIAMSALANLEERAKIERTKTIIKRIDGAIMEKWESYKTRALPIRMPTPEPGAANWALIRLRALRNLQRMEMPERATDIDGRIGPNGMNPIDNVDLANGLSYPSNHPIVALRNTPLPPLLMTTRPSTYNRYRRIVDAKPATWADTYAQSELLYLILSGMRDSTSSPLDFLSPSEVGDLDGDGLKEVLDGWGQPIWFLRWAPGYIKELPANTLNVANTNQSNTIPDSFDPLKTDPLAYGLRPLIMSAGPDRVFDLYLEYNIQGDKNKDIRYADSTSGNVNYPLKIWVNNQTTPLEGTPYDISGDGANWVDNITNHYVETP